ncbi:sensor histidine kinase [Hamadaea sp.]|uniref:sensor histidine kinase n=1 Tax=Hamadaea sp. TaxID=2024425 RepID=UPI0025C056C5|nr:sensor histidine kinase [Hamadaea sp.]
MRWTANLTAGWPWLGAVVLGVAAVAESAVRTSEHPDVASFAALTALAMAAPLALARLWPGIAAALSGSACLLGLFLGAFPPAAGLVALTVLYLNAGIRREPWTGLVLVLPFAAYAVTPVAADRPGGRTLAVVLFAITALTVAGGAAYRARGEAQRQAAANQAVQDSLLEHIARGERARIARELHDVVAHHISLIAVQAEAARLTTPGMPPEGAKRLVAIGDTARTALTEMRRLLGVLREDTATAPVTPVRRPQPTLQNLTELLDEVRDLGSGSARLIVSGPVAPLDQGIELTAYRIVQEALTNARRHAAGAAVDVELHYRPDALLVRVRDSGPGPSVAAPGHGLAGMLERAAMAGGQLIAGPGRTGGFVVEAVLPIAKGDQ